MTLDQARFSQAITEAANRAEATALLIRAGYRVYRPEADIHGEDMVVRVPDGSSYHGVQLKSGPVVDQKYHGHKLWVLFPIGQYEPDLPRRWFLLEHDPFFQWVKQQHGHTPGWEKSPRWSYPSLSKKLAAFLAEHELKPLDTNGMRFVETGRGAKITDADGNPVDLGKRITENSK